MFLQSCAHCLKDSPLVCLSMHLRCEPVMKLIFFLRGNLDIFTFIQFFFLILLPLTGSFSRKGNVSNFWRLLSVHWKAVFVFSSADHSVQPSVPEVYNTSTIKIMYSPLSTAALMAGFTVRILFALTNMIVVKCQHCCKISKWTSDWFSR